MINVATTILLFISLVSARQHTAHQQSLRARGCETEQAFSRDGSIRSPGGLPEKVKACMSSNGEITQVTFQNKDGSDIRTLRVSDKRLVDDDSKSFGFEALGPNIFLIYPDTVGVGGSLTFYADRDESELDLDDAITMVQNYNRRFEQQLFSSSRNENELFSDPADVIAAFRSSASYVQDIIQRLEDRTSTGDEKEKVESAKNGMCETFNRLSQLYVKVAAAFDEALNRKPAPPLSPKARKLLDKAAKSGGESLAKQILKLVEEAAKEGTNPTASATLNTLKENEKTLKKEFTAGIVAFVESHPDTIGEIFETGAKIEAVGKEKADKILKASKEKADEIFEYIKKVWKNLFDSAKEAKEKVGSDETKTPPDCTFFV